MTIEIPFIGGAYQGQSTNINAQVCQNLYPIADMVGGKTALALRNTPGMKLWSTPGGSNEYRGNYVWNDHLYAIIGSGLYKITSGGFPTSVGTLSTSTGRVFMAGGLSYLMVIEENGNGYYQDTDDTTLTQITDTDFPSPGSLDYFDGYFIVTQYNTDYFYISDTEDPSSWQGLEFLAAEDTPDDVITIKKHNREMWMFGEETTEIFGNTGNTTFPLSRIAGGVLPVGVGAKDSVAEGPEGLFLLDNLYRPRMIDGYNMVAIAPEQIEYQIYNYDTKDDAHGYCYTQEGHEFYVLTFPSAGKTWCFDKTTGLWHTLSSGITGGIHRGVHGVWFADKVLVGDKHNGNIYELDPETYSDVDVSNRRLRTAQSLHLNRQLLTFSRFELEFEAGTGLVTGQGSDPQAMLDWSDDGGHTWSNEHWTDIGEIGKYGTRAIWRRLGSSRSRIFRVAISDPVKIIIIGAFLQ